MPSMKWDFSTVADQLGEVLSAAEAELRLEQAVYGLDVKDEREIQSLLAQRLSARYEVVREVHYPSTRGRKLSQRPRCDVVLTPQDVPLEPAEAPEQTLFTLPAALMRY